MNNYYKRENRFVAFFCDYPRLKKVAFFLLSAVFVVSVLFVLITLCKSIYWLIINPQNREGGNLFSLIWRLIVQLLPIPFVVFVVKQKKALMFLIGGVALFFLVLLFRLALQSLLDGFFLPNSTDMLFCVMDVVSISFLLLFMSALFGLAVYVSLRAKQSTAPRV